MQSSPRHHQENTPIYILEIEMSPEKGCHFKRKGLSSNHYFLGDMLVFRGVWSFPGQKKPLWSFWNFHPILDILHMTDNTTRENDVLLILWSSLFLNYPLVKPNIAIMELSPIFNMGNTGNTSSFSGPFSKLSAMLTKIPKSLVWVPSNLGVLTLVFYLETICWRI